MRRLREYEHIAEKLHDCDRCFTQIHPGDLYKGSVFATSKSILVLKEHLIPYCSVDPDDDMRADLEEFGGLEGILEKVPESIEFPQRAA